MLLTSELEHGFARVLRAQGLLDNLGPDPTLLAPVVRALQGKKMELYAGMVENMDHHIGRLVDHLKKIGEYENTIFVFFGDNGAEGSDLFGMIAGSPGSRDFLFAAVNWNQTHINAWGDPGSFVGYGPMWAQVSMTPFSQYKGLTGEGGIRNALVVSGPAVKRAKGSINHGLMHVGDLMPTMLEVAGASYPKALNGQELPPLMGKSWLPVLAGQAESPRTEQDYLAWQLFGNRAVRKRARLKYTIDDRGIHWFRDEVERRAGFPLGPARPFAFDHNGDRFGWVEGDDGRWHLTLRLLSGRIQDGADGDHLSGLRHTGLKDV